jgi:molybdenum cofactor cytidylyltransferase
MASRPQPALCALVLAAGEGRRFDPTGRTWKLVEPLADSRPVIRAVCENLTAFVDELVVVCGEHEAEAVDALAGLPVRSVRCAEAAAGMGATIKCGIRATDPSIGWLVALADMPFVSSRTLAALCEALRSGAPIVRPMFGGRPGHPVGFAASLRGELLGIDDRGGASALVRRRAAHVVQLATDDPGCVHDIDLPADLKRFGDARAR